MAFCEKCGNKLSETAQFCANCGGKVNKINNQSQRKIVYDGEIHKCSNCGEKLNSFVAKCPSCGHELRNVKVNSSVKELAEKMENASNEKQKITIIKSFPIPNTREDILEFMLLASSNFDSLYYVTHLNEDDVSDAWLIKIDQCYQKAKMLFGEKEDLEKIESIYKEIKNDCCEKERIVKNEQKKQALAQEIKGAEDIFKRSGLRIVIIIFSIISALCCVTAFNDKRILAGIVAIAMIALFAIAYLMGSGVIKAKVKNMHLIFVWIAFIFFILYFFTYLKM